MTNGEKYEKKPFFRNCRLPKGSLQEVENMAKLQRRIKMKTAAAVIAGCISLEEQVLHMQRMLEASSVLFRSGSMEIRRRRP